MVSIARSIGSVGSQILSLPTKTIKSAAKGSILGLSCVANIATGSVPAFASLYLQYMVAAAAFDVVSGYAGQYNELEGGFQDVGFTPKVIGKLFNAKHVSGNSWNVLEPVFDGYNIKDVQDVLLKIHEHIEDTNIMQVMTAQILSKVLIGKNAHFIKIGNKVKVPTVDQNGDKKLVEYTFDKKFNLWQGIPAFGLIDVGGKAAPLLIFKSTNTNLEEADTLPTLVANLHPKGPGWKLFSESQEEVAVWLKQANQQSEKKARTIGYSLGGILASYFLTYHSAAFNKDEHQPSLILDAPGVNHNIEKDWLDIEKKPFVKTYVNRGDLIPKVGDAFIGSAFEVRIAQKIKGFDSHRALSLFAPQWKIVEISTHCEKKSTSRSILSGMRKIASVTYNPVKKLLLPCMQGIFHS